MVFFSRKNVAFEDKPAFPRTILRQALTLHNWQSGAIVIHVEVAGQSFLKFNTLNRKTGEVSSWTELRMSSSAEGDQEMTRLLEHPSYIQTLFEEAESSSIDFVSAEGWKEKYGFSEFLANFTFDQVMQMVRGEIDFPSDDESDELSFGNFLAEQLNDGSYFPNSTEAVSLFWGFLNESSMQVGLFGNYKYILKSLSNRLQKVLDFGDPDVTAALAGCLGSGYGQIEAYLSKGNISPNSFLERITPELLTLAHLPEFGGKAYPSLRTAQYLSRRGLRLFKQIEKQCDSVTQTRFRVNLLNIADIFDERSSRFPEYQLLVDYLTHGEFGVLAREKSGRKLLSTEVGVRDTLANSDDFVSGLSEGAIEIFSNWIPELSANNPVITQFAFELSSKLDTDFVWSENAIKALGESASELVQQALIKEISVDSTRFFHLSIKDQVRFLRLLSFETTEKLFSSPHFAKLANEWAIDCSQRDLSLDDIKISKVLLSGRRGRFASDALMNLIVNLSRHTQLEPFEEWKRLVSLQNRNIYWLSNQDFLSYIGADSSKQGVFDFLRAPSREVLEFFAGEITHQLQWANQEVVNQTLSAILEANSSSLQSVGRLVLRKRLLGTKKHEELFEFVNSPDLQLAIIGDLVLEEDQTGLLSQFVYLAGESERVFWRKNSKDLETLLQDWAIFPRFLWANLEELPEFVRETLLAYEWLGGKLLAFVTPGAVSKLSQTQAEIFLDLLKKNKSALENDSLLRAILSAPNARVNEFGAQHLKQVNRYAEFWLVMLESNLPVSTQASYNFLEGQTKESNFADTLLMALDSNNKNARTLALRLLKEKANPQLLEQLIHKLVESKTDDVWSVVRQNLNLVKNQSELKIFTRRVFLSRRQARMEKEKIKQQLASVVTSISDAVESEILLRMSFSSVAKDREWALKQIALGHLSTNDAIVETSWRGH